MFPLMNSLTKCTDSAALWDSCVPCLSACERDVADLIRFIPVLGSCVFVVFVFVVVLVVVLA